MNCSINITSNNCKLLLQLYSKHCHMTHSEVDFKWIYSDLVWVCLWLQVSMYIQDWTCYITFREMSYCLVQFYRSTALLSCVPSIVWWLIPLQLSGYACPWPDHNVCIWFWVSTVVGCAAFASVITVVVINIIITVIVPSLQVVTITIGGANGVAVVVRLSAQFVEHFRMGSLEFFHEQFYWAQYVLQRGRSRGVLPGSLMDGSAANINDHVHGKT